MKTWSARAGSMSCKHLLNRLLHGSTTMTNIEKAILWVKDESVVCFLGLFLIIYLSGSIWSVLFIEKGNKENE